MKGKLKTYESYGNVFKSTAELFTPKNIAELKAIIADCKNKKRKIAVAGGFNSFDRQNSSSDVVISLRHFNTIEYNSNNHSIRVGAGAKWGDILDVAYSNYSVLYTCITGSHPTAGGTLSTHSHSMWAPGVGKEGNYCLEFEILCTNGELLRCSRTENKDLFYGAISGFGMLGFIVSITYQLFHIGEHFELEISTTDHDDIEALEKKLDLRKPAKIDSLDKLRSQSTLFYLDKGQAKVTVYNRKYRKVKKKKKNSKFLFYQAVLANGFIRLFPSMVNRILIKDAQRSADDKWLINGLRAIKHGTFWADPDYYWTKYCSNFLRIFGYKTHLYQMTHFIPAGEEKVTEFTKKVYELLDKYQLRFCMFDVMYVPKDEPFVLSASRYTDGFYVNTTFMDYVKKDVLMSFYEELNDLCYRMKGKIYLAKNCFCKDGLLEDMHREEMEEFVQLKEKHDPSDLLESDFFKVHFPSFFGKGKYSKQKS